MSDQLRLMVLLEELSEAIKDTEIPMTDRLAAALDALDAYEEATRATHPAKGESGDGPALTAGPDYTESLESMVRQHCTEHPDGSWDTGAIGANAEAVIDLEAAGRLTIERGLGRMLVFRWND